MQAVTRSAAVSLLLVLSLLAMVSMVSAHPGGRGTAVEAVVHAHGEDLLGAPSGDERPHDETGSDELRDDGVSTVDADPSSERGPGDGGPSHHHHHHGDVDPGTLFTTWTPALTRAEPPRPRTDILAATWPSEGENRPD